MKAAFVADSGTVRYDTADEAAETDVAADATTDVRSDALDATSD